MSTQQDFDRLLKDRLSNMGMEPTEDKWAVLQQKLQTIQPLTPASGTDVPAMTLAWYQRPWIKGTAAAIVILLSVTTSLLLKKNDHQQVADATTSNVTTNNVATNPTIASSEVTTDNTTTAVNPSTNNTTAESPNVNTSVPINSNSTNVENDVVNVNKNINTTPKQVVAANTHTQLPVPNNTQNNLAVNQQNNLNNNNVTPTTHQPTSNQPIKNDVVTPSNTQTAVANATPKNNTTAPNHPPKQNMPFELQERPRYAKVWPKSSINIVASSALGSLGVKTSAYNIGVNTERKINNRMFVEGTIAYASNNPTGFQNAIYSQANEQIASKNAVNATAGSTTPTPTLDVYGVSHSDFSFRAGGNNIPVEDLATQRGIAEAAAYRLASTQIEATPTFGYRITPRIAIMTGADVSRTLRTSKYDDGVNHLNLINRTPIQLNNWDAGLVGKVECKVSKRIIVGARYRAGLTNIVDNSSINTRRNYAGVVLKTRLR